MFAEGNFQAPMLIHDRVPPGVPVLKKLKKGVSYRYEEIDGGGRVRISTVNQEAVSAAHDFLRFQIADAPHRRFDNGWEVRIGGPANSHGGVCIQLGC